MSILAVLPSRVSLYFPSAFSNIVEARGSHGSGWEYRLNTIQQTEIKSEMDSSSLIPSQKSQTQTCSWTLWHFCWPLFFSPSKQKGQKDKNKMVSVLPQILPSWSPCPLPCRLHFFSPPLSLLLPLASWVPTFPYTHGTETALRAFSGREHLGKIIEALVYPSHTLVLAKLAKKWRDMPEQGLKTW